MNLLLAVGAAVVTALLMIGGLLWAVAKMPPSTRRLQPYARDDDAGSWPGNSGADGSEGHVDGGGGH